MKRFIIAPLSVLAVAAASLTGAGSASAAAGADTRVVSPSPAACFSGEGCLWRNKDYGSDRVGFHFSKKDLSKVKAGSGSANDIASSVYNNGNFKKLQFWHDVNYKGPSIVLDKQNGDRNLTDAAGTVKKVFNDRISSGKFIN